MKNSKEVKNLIVLALNKCLRGMLPFADVLEGYESPPQVQKTNQDIGGGGDAEHEESESESDDDEVASEPSDAPPDEVAADSGQDDIGEDNVENDIPSDAEAEDRDRDGSDGEAPAEPGADDEDTRRRLKTKVIKIKKQSPFMMQRNSNLPSRFNFG